MRQRRSLGIPPHLFCEPLVRGAKALRGFDVRQDAQALLAIALRKRNLDVALIGPLDYAREGSLYRIIPGVAVSSRGSNSSIMLYFREGIRSIESLAVDPRSASEIILARIILSEEFNVIPSVVPVDGPIDEMLRRADAAVVAGDAALRPAPTHRNSLDLGEAWEELTGLPVVHGLFCCRGQGITDVEAKSIGALGQQREATLSRIGRDAVAAHALSGHDAGALTSYLQSFSYALEEDVQEGMVEYLKLAYYHGILSDVPELSFFSDEDAEGRTED
jgi:chorismate dehydratase